MREFIASPWGTDVASKEKRSRLLSSRTIFGVLFSPFLFFLLSTLSLHPSLTRASDLGGFQVEVGEGVGNVPSGWNEQSSVPTQAPPAQPIESSPDSLQEENGSPSQADAGQMELSYIPAQPIYDTGAFLSPQWDSGLWEENSTTANPLLGEGENHTSGEENGSSSPLLPSSGASTQTIASSLPSSEASSLPSGEPQVLFFADEELYQQAGTGLGGLKAKEDYKEKTMQKGISQVPTVEFSRILDYPGGVYIETESSMSVLSFRLDQKEVPFLWKGSLLLPVDAGKRKRARIDLALLVDGKYIVCVHFSS